MKVLELDRVRSGHCLLVVPRGSLFLEPSKKFAERVERIDILHTPSDLNRHALAADMLIED